MAMSSYFSHSSRVGKPSVPANLLGSRCHSTGYHGNGGISRLEPLTFGCVTVDSQNIAVSTFDCVRVRSGRHSNGDC